MSNEPFSARFRKGRQSKKLTQAAAAEVLGVSQSAIAQWETGRSLPSPAIAAQVEKSLGVKYVHGEGRLDASMGLGPRDRAPRLPIAGAPVAGDEERILVDGSPKGEIFAPHQLEGVLGASAVYVRGRLMEPRYFAGEIVYLHPSRRPNPGDFVFLTLREPGFLAGVGYIRQYVGDDLMHFRVRTLNPDREQLVPRDSLIGIATIVGSGLF
jgi:transcriptional regulator with XRE-family HTH domain